MVKIGNTMDAEGTKRESHPDALARPAGLPLVLAVLVLMSVVLAVALGAILVPTSAQRTATSLQIPGEPVANAGFNQTVPQHKDVMLDGRGSSDPDDPFASLAFTWTFSDGTQVTLMGATPHYVFDNLGSFVIMLNVTDPAMHYSTDNVTILVQVDIAPPVANAGPNRTVGEGTNDTMITLNASKSTDNAAIASYEWSFEYRGQQYTFDVPVVEFNFTKAGRYTVTLTVTDASGLTNSTSITVTVKAKPTFWTEHWIGIIIWSAIGIVAVLYIVTKLRRDRMLITDADKEKAKLQWKSAKKTWKIFRSNRLGFAGILILIVFVLMALFAPYISTVKDPLASHSIEEERPIVDPITGNTTGYQWRNPSKPSWDPSPFSGYRHIMGTDGFGRDVYSLTVYGTRASLEVGLIATLISVALGASIGLAAGYFGRVTDEVLMRVTDFFLVLPWFPLMIVVMAILGQKFIWVIVVIGITSWPSTARIVRSQVLSIKERQFVERARCVGAGDSHIIARHVMPNVLPLIFANTVLLISLAIFSEAFLDFFGLGDPSVISWGFMLEEAYHQGAFNLGAWWWILVPGAAIVVMVLSFSLVGYALDDVLNPKLRRR